MSNPMPSALDTPVTLRELVDIEGFREVCRSFCELYGVSLKVFDVSGSKLVDVRATDAALSTYLFSVPATQVMFTNLVTQLKGRSFEGSPPAAFAIEDFCGLRYRVSPILHDGSLVGRLIFGPYASPTLAGPPESLRRYEPELDMAKLTELMAQIPRVNDLSVERVLAHMQRMVDVILHASYETLLVSRMHIASITGAFDDLKRVNRELVDANEQLRELDRLKSNFVATVSHELRTPLTSVIGYSEMLLEGIAGELNPEQRDYVKTILEKGESLLALIGQVLDLSRIESGNVSMRRALTLPADLISLCVSDVLPQAQKKKIALDVEVADGLEPIRIDADKIRRVLTNLLGNAVKFTGEGGRIVVKAARGELGAADDGFNVFEPEKNRALVIAVQDNGIGIPQDKLGKVFDAFYQVDNTSTRAYGGTGLGLSIARSFVQAHHGRLDASSAPGEGSTFTITLPYDVATDVKTAELDLQEARL